MEVALPSCPWAAVVVLAQGWPPGALQPGSVNWRTSSSPLLDCSAMVCCETVSDLVHAALGVPLM